jgi:hypothetical protein
VIYRCERDLHSNLLAEIFEHYVIEILRIVDCNVSGNAVTTDNVLPEVLIEVELTLVSDFASIHFVKYSTATTVKV